MRCYSLFRIPIALAAAGCGSTSPSSNLPAADGAALWSYMQQQNYASAWTLWPGKGTLYASCDRARPECDAHGMLLTTYLNSAALNALTSHAGTMPPGAIIVKQNYMPDSTLAAITVMYKVKGYDAAHDDWFWLKVAPNDSVLAEGQVGTCIGCHGGNASNDYIWTASLH